MFPKSSTIVICVIGGLHLLFMLGELFPWPSPFIMDKVLEKWPERLDLSPADRRFAATVVHNAGIYNGIVAAGLFAAASLGPAGLSVQLALLAGGVAAGIFGAATLTPATIVQAIAGGIAIVAVLYTT